MCPRVLARQRAAAQHSRVSSSWRDKADTCLTDCSSISEGLEPGFGPDVLLKKMVEAAQVGIWMANAGEKRIDENAALIIGLVSNTHQPQNVEVQTLKHSNNFYL